LHKRKFCIIFAPNSDCPSLRQGNLSEDRNTKMKTSTQQLKTMQAKMKFLGRHWRDLLWDVVKTTIAGFGIIITFSDALLNVLPEESTLHSWLYKLVHLPFDHPATLLIAIGLLMLIGAIMNWPKTKATYKDPQTDIRVIVECCDLFDQDGLRVIHCVDTFDTALGTIISPRSVHGLFLARCKQAGVDADAEIDNALRFTEPEARDEELPGRKDRYALGTVCPVNIGQTTYGLVSFSHLQKEGNISITRKEYVNFFMTMWKNLSAPTLRQDVVNVAVMGNRFVDLPSDFSTEQKIDMMIQTFFAATRKKSCCRTLRICVHESNMVEVDFPRYEIIIDHLAKRPII